MFRRYEALGSWFGKAREARNEPEPRLPMAFERVEITRLRPLRSFTGSVIERSARGITLYCSEEIAPGSCVRLDSREVHVHGLVTDCVAAGAVWRISVGIRPANPYELLLISETPALR